jgi:hypothetical protein
MGPEMLGLADAAECGRSQVETGAEGPGAGRGSEIGGPDLILLTFGLSIELCLLLLSLCMRHNETEYDEEMGERLTCKRKISNCIICICNA